MEKKEYYNLKMKTDNKKLCNKVKEEYTSSDVNLISITEIYKRYKKYYSKNDNRLQNIIINIVYFCIIFLSNILLSFIVFFITLTLSITEFIPILYIIPIIILDIFLVINYTSFKDLMYNYYMKFFRGESD